MRDNFEIEKIISDAEIENKITHIKKMFEDACNEKKDSLDEKIALSEKKEWFKMIKACIFKKNYY